MSTRHIEKVIPLGAIAALILIIVISAQARVTMSAPDEELGQRLRTCIGLDPACVAAMGGDLQVYGSIVAATNQFAGDHFEQLTPLVNGVEAARKARLHELETYDDSQHEGDGTLLALDNALESASVQLRAACSSLETTLEQLIPPTFWNRCVNSEASRLLDPRCGMLTLQINQITDLKAALRTRDRVIVHHSRRAHMHGVKEAWDHYDESVASTLMPEQEAQWLTAETQMSAHFAALMESDLP